MILSIITLVLAIAISQISIRIVFNKMVADMREGIKGNIK